MQRTSLRGSRLRSRPFYATLLVISTLAAYSFISHRGRNSDPANVLVPRSKTYECRDVNLAKDQCAFIRKYCLDEDAGLLPYLELYYCYLGNAQPLAFTILTVWLGLLFTTIGIAASDFFSINLSTIATILGLSESLAGVTFLAFGNGSPDVFSTFAAMGSNSASMAVGELLGAACFITAVVAGSMSLVREFKVSRNSYVRDICFFIIAVIFTTAFLLDGKLYFWECWVMIGYYAVYVVVVVGSHYYSRRNREIRRREGESRSHYYGTFAGRNTDELAGTPYRDDPDDENSSSRHGAGHSDLSALENGPRIEIDGNELHDDEELERTDSNTDHDRIVAAEVSRGMRVLRRGGRRATTTITPIRPSLVGVLEFRSALAQLQRESNLPLGTIRGPGRSRSENHLTRRARRLTTPAADASHSDALSVIGHEHHQSHHGRLRAHSSCIHQVSTSAPADTLSPDGHDLSQHQPHGSNVETNETFDMNSSTGGLGPPLLNLPPPVINSQPTNNGRPTLYLDTPSRCSSCTDLSSEVAEFPAYTESPSALTPHSIHDRTSSFPVSVRSTRRDDHSIPLDLPPSRRPIYWWPYAILPPPHVLLATLFPTLQNWGEKSYWDKFISTISVPSIFLLVSTLPVVEVEGKEEDDSSGGTVIAAPQRSPSITPMLGSAVQAVALEGEETLVASSENRDTAPKQVVTKTASSCPPSSDDPSDTGDWNRWLVCVQLFTGPLFAVFILWANMKDDLIHPRKVLLRMTLFSLVGSLVLLAVLLVTTTAHVRPKYHALMCFLGFIISIAWISTVAGEVVGVLKTFGVVLDISEALLGLTIFAAGNSIGDLVANITVARLGYPVMAL